MAAIESLSFFWPLAAIAWPLPWLVRRYWPAGGGDTALRVPALADFAAAAATGRGRGGRGDAVVAGFAAVAWTLFVFALARPQIADAGRPLAESGRELMIALDTSASMDTRDLRLDGRAASRLDVARRLAGEFVGRRDGDRVGLVVFGSRAFLHTPLSFDLAALQAALREVAVELAGRETAIGDALALAVKRLREHGDSARVLVLLTDGAHNAGELTPEQALWIARREGIKIFTVGIGASRLRVADADGYRDIDPSIGLDEGLLKRLAEQTGGVYQRATDAAAMADFFRRLDALEPAGPAARADRRPGRELYAWPLAAALLIVGALAWRGLRDRATADPDLRQRREAGPSGGRVDSGLRRPDRGAEPASVAPSRPGAARQSGGGVR